MAVKSAHSRKISALCSLLLLASPWLLVSCSDEDGPPPPPCCLTLVIEQIPEALPAGHALFFPIVIKAENGDFSGIDSLTCEMLNPEGEYYTTFYLFDDGSAYDHVEGSDFLGLRSGDNVPGDGRYTRQISGQGFSGSFGAYLLQFSASGAQSVIDSIDITPVTPPSFASVTLHTNFPSGFEPVEYEAHIQKPTAIDRIDSVYVQILDEPYWPLRRIQFVIGLTDTVWSLTLTPSHFWDIPTGNTYEFHFTLWDRFGLSADTVQQSISIANGIPTVLNSALPDTIWRPRLGEPNDTTAISVQADDPESLMDIAEVRFEVRKVWQDWQSSPDFYLLDLGGRWDAVAGDGIYSVPLVTSPSDSLKNTLYYFRFYATDRTGQQSNNLIDSIRVIERPATLAVVGLQTRNGRSLGKTGVGVVL